MNEKGPHFFAAELGTPAMLDLHDRRDQDDHELGHIIDQFLHDNRGQVVKIVTGVGTGKMFTRVSRILETHELVIDLKPAQNKGDLLVHVSE